MAAKGRRLCAVLRKRGAKGRLALEWENGMLFVQSRAAVDVEMVEISAEVGEVDMSLLEENSKRGRGEGRHYSSKAYAEINSDFELMSIGDLSDAEMREKKPENELLETDFDSVIDTSEGPQPVERLSTFDPITTKVTDSPPFAERNAVIDKSFSGKANPPETETFSTIEPHSPAFSKDTDIHPDIQTYISTLRQGSLEVRECLRVEDTVLQDTESKLQANVDNTQKGLESLSKLAEVKSSQKSAWWPHKEKLTPFGLLFLPLRIVTGMLRAIVTALIFPMLFACTLWVILSIPKK